MDSWPEELPDDVAWALEGMLSPARNREWYRKLRAAMLGRAKARFEAANPGMNWDELHPDTRALWENRDV